MHEKSYGLTDENEMKWVMGMIMQTKSIMLINAAKQMQKCIRYVSRIYIRSLLEILQHYIILPKTLARVLVNFEVTSFFLVNLHRRTSILHSSLVLRSGILRNCCLNCQRIFKCF